MTETDVGRQKSGEPSVGLIGGVDQCVRCFRSTDGSGSDMFCGPCLIELRGGR